MFIAIQYSINVLTYLLVCAWLHSGLSGWQQIDRGDSGTLWETTSVRGFTDHPQFLGQPLKSLSGDAYPPVIKHEKYENGKPAIELALRSMEKSSGGLSIAMIEYQKVISMTIPFL